MNTAFQLHELITKLGIPIIGPLDNIDIDVELKEEIKLDVDLTDPNFDLEKLILDLKPNFICMYTETGFSAFNFKTLYTSMIVDDCISEDFENTGLVKSWLVKNPESIGEIKALKNINLNTIGSVYVGICTIDGKATLHQLWLDDSWYITLEKIQRHHCKLMILKNN